MTNLTNKIVLLTGASRGLGYQTSKLLAKKGAHVLGVARTIGALESLSNEIANFGGSSTMIPLDLDNDTSLENLAQEIYQNWGRIDILIHAAGISVPLSPVYTMELNDLEKLFRTNTRALVKLIQVIHPLLKISENGIAVFIDDQHSGKFFGGYSASKNASRALINSYRDESKRLGIKVLSFVPKPMPTNLRARFYPGEGKDNLSNTTSEAKKLLSIFGS